MPADCGNQRWNRYEEKHKQERIGLDKPLQIEQEGTLSGVLCRRAQSETEYLDLNVIRPKPLPMDHKLVCRPRQAQQSNRSCKLPNPPQRWTLWAPQDRSIKEEY